MREHKFKAWDKLNKRMEDIDGGYLYLAEGKVYEIYESSHYYNVYMEKKDVSDRYILLEYTGLNDKYGEEIYEGYIVKADQWNPSVGEIRFIEGGFCVFNEEVADYPTDINMYYSSTGCMLEVIGNIFENPELLKSK